MVERAGREECAAAVRIHSSNSLFFQSVYCLKTEGGKLEPGVMPSMVVVGFMPIISKQYVPPPAAPWELPVTTGDMGCYVANWEDRRA